MEVKVKFNEINVKEEKEQTLVKVLMLKGDKGDPGATDYNDLINKPTKLSDFTNDGVFITNNTEDLTNYYRKSETYTQPETDNLLGNKVDKVSGKGLSTEDYTTSEKTKLSNIESQANKTTIVQSTGSSTSSVMSQNAVTTQLSNKVDKVSGKGLSTEDYTTTEKTKLSNIESQANKTTIVQSTGSSTTSVMSQNAVTNALPIVENGTFTPRLSCRADEGGTTDPTYTIYYNYGKYKRINNICFITFHIKAKITNKGIGYSTIANLPYKSTTNVGGQALAIQELGGAIKGADGISDIVRGMGATIPDDTYQVNLEHNNGMTAITWDIGDVWVGCTGFYFINES